MPDIYTFRVPIIFEIEVPGVSVNPNHAVRLQEEITKVVHTLIRAAPTESLFDSPVEFAGKTIRMSASLGHLATHRIPSRFKDTDVHAWSSLAREIVARSKTHKDSTTGQVLKKRSLPYTVGRYAYMIDQWMMKYGFIQEKQKEMLAFWAEKYMTTYKPPTPVQIASVKQQKAILTKAQKAWMAMDEEGIESEVVDDW